MAALASLATIALFGCTSAVANGSTVRVVVSQPFSSYNVKTFFGNMAVNASIVAVINSHFNCYDNRPALHKDESFGTYQVVSCVPFRMKYTICDGVE